MLAIPLPRAARSCQVLQAAEGLSSLYLSSIHFPSLNFFRPLLLKHYKPPKSDLGPNTRISLCLWPADSISSSHGHCRGRLHPTTRLLMVYKVLPQPLARVCLRPASRPGRNYYPISQVRKTKVPRSQASQSGAGTQAWLVFRWQIQGGLPWYTPPPELCPLDSMCCLWAREVLP